jgi:hypothetical protein
VDEAEERSDEPTTESTGVPRELPPDQRRKVSDEDVMTMVTLSAGGLTNVRIAEKFDISAQRVGQLLQQHDPRRRSPVLGQVGLHPRQMFEATG